MRWYYHRSPFLRHDSSFSLKSFLLINIHKFLIVNHPEDFKIYKNQIDFRSTGNVMATQGYYVGEIEYHLVQYINKQIKPNFVMLDVGAHHGLYTTIVAFELMKRGWKGSVHSFEPDPQNFSILSYNVSQNKLEKYVHMHSKAIAEYMEESHFLIHKSDNSSNSLEKAASKWSQKRNFSQEDSIFLQTISLDEYCSTLEKINLIKLDIQGAEPMALRGAKRIIAQHKPIVVVEAVQGWDTTFETEKILKSYGYKIYSLSKYGDLCARDSSETYVSWDWIGLPQN